MLIRLSIHNYALINHIDIDFQEGLSIITGETGAGKSIMLGALSMILGERAEVKSIGNTDKKSVIEAEFSILEYGLENYFRQNDLEWEEARLILRREIAISGRSRAFVNDSPVSLQQLKDLAIRLVDIHSQHQNQLLSDPKYQLKIIDSIADNKEEREAYREQFKKYVEKRNHLNSIKTQLSKNRENEEFLRFQIEQLSRLNPQIGEQDHLERQYEILSNTESLREELEQITNMLAANEDSVLSQLSQVRVSLGRINLNLFVQNSGDSDTLIQRFENSYLELKDIADTFQDYLGKVEADPNELERIDTRLNAIYEVNRRFNVTNEDELVSVKNNIDRQLSKLDSSDENIDLLAQELRHEGVKLREFAEILTASRNKAAKRFSNELSNRAMPLGMPNIKFAVSIEKGRLSIDGQDEVCFLCAFNKNQDLMPVSKVASGGEISRIMLCVKTIIANKMHLPTIIFDEVDTGVSGEIANKMGEMMKEIASSIQVITITHLPQVASKGETHYKVFKIDNEDSTVTHIKQLDAEERLRELALMLSGSKVDNAAILNAKSLLNQ